MRLWLGNECEDVGAKVLKIDEAVFPNGRDGTTQVASQPIQVPQQLSELGEGQQQLAEQTTHYRKSRAGVLVPLPFSGDVNMNSPRCGCGSSDHAYIQ